MTRGLATFAMAAAAVAGCSAGVSFTETPNGSTSATDATSADTPDVTPATGPRSPGRDDIPPRAVGAAPQVARPLIARAFVAAPCSALTAADLTDLGDVAPTAQATQSPENPYCEWHSDPNVEINETIRWMTGDTNGLSDVYQRQALGRPSSGSPSTYWDPTTISGYPAVFAEPSFTISPQICALNVGVSDRLYFVVEFFAPTGWSGSCSGAARTATAVIKNLQGNQ